MSEVNFFLSYGMAGGICVTCGKFMLPKPFKLEKKAWECPHCNTRIRQVIGDDGSIAYLKEEKGIVGKFADAVNPLKKPFGSKDL